MSHGVRVYLIAAQSVKEVLQSLVDDGMVDADRIGTSMYFWAFPSKAANTVSEPFIWPTSTLSLHDEQVKASTKLSVAAQASCFQHGGLTGGQFSIDHYKAISIWFDVSQIRWISFSLKPKEIGDTLYLIRNITSTHVQACTQAKQPVNTKIIIFIVPSLFGLPPESPYKSELSKKHKAKLQWTNTLTHCQKKW